MDTRNYLQNWYDGRDGRETEFFSYEKGDLWQVGVEISGIIYYGYPTTGKLLVNLVDDDLGAIIEKLYEMSKARIEVLAEHCPTLVQMFMDGVNRRFDTAAVVNVCNKWEIVAVIDHFDFKEMLKKHGIGALVDSLVINKVLKMTDLRHRALRELSNWDGFTTFEEVKITAKEVLPGARVGYNIAKILSGGLV